MLTTHMNRMHRLISQLLDREMYITPHQTPTLQAACRSCLPTLCTHSFRKMLQGQSWLQFGHMLSTALTQS